MKNNMEMEVKPNINILTWAIRRAGYEMSDFVSKFPKVEDWLNERKKPTLKQLEEFSNRVHLPFGYLFLEDPPQESISFPFFRTGGSKSNKVSLNVYDTIQLIQKRQDWLTEYLADNDFKKLPFVGQFAQNLQARPIVESIRQHLGVPDDWASRLATWTEALDFITTKIEEAGIVVMFSSVVENNNHRPLDVQECRGFVLVNAYAPFLFVNAADGKAAQLFTILHELAHVWAGESAGFDRQQMLPANDPLEIICDQVAAEFLVPEALFKRYWTGAQNISVTARRFKVSPIVLARRALDLGKLNKTDYLRWYHDYQAELYRKGMVKTDGGDFYATQRKRLGMRFATFIDLALKGRQLLYRDAYKLTGLKGDTYETFAGKLI